MEKIVYELKPFFCVWMGSHAIAMQEMLRIGRLPAALLVLCGLAMLYWRLSYRGVLGEQRRRDFLRDNK